MKKKCKFSEEEIKRRNFILYGIKEHPLETFEDLKKSVLQILNHTMTSDVTMFELDHIYRLGKKNSRSRPVLVKCLNQWRKEEIMKKAKYLKNTGIYIDHDLTKTQIVKRREMVKEMLEVRKQGDYAVVRKDKLVVLNENKEQNLSMIPNEEEHTARKSEFNPRHQNTSEGSSSSSIENEEEVIHEKKKREKPKNQIKIKKKSKTKLRGKKRY